MGFQLICRFVLLQAFEELLVRRCMLDDKLRLSVDGQNLWTSSSAEPRDMLSRVSMEFS